MHHNNPIIIDSRNLTAELGVSVLIKLLLPKFYFVGYRGLLNF